MKRVIPKVTSAGELPYETYYVRDASGNIMATYKRYYYKEFEGTSFAEERFEVEEHHLYGSSRMGVTNSNTILAYRYGANLLGEYEPETPEYTIPTPPAADAVTYLVVGRKNYELTNHLGNVLATITDRKVPNLVWNATANNYDITYFNAQATTITDYYPFGQQIEERSWVAPTNKYRFGFNGKENDNEVKGSGNQQDYGMRIHDTRLGRFLSVDPITTDYPWYSPYQFAGNTPIQAIDLDGLEPLFTEESRRKAVQEGSVLEKAIIYGAEFSVAFWNTIALGLGTLTEIPGQMHHGDNLSAEQKKKVFLLTYDQNFGTMALNTVVAPLQAAGDVCENPQNPTAWGKLLGIGVMYTPLIKSQSPVKSRPPVKSNVKKVNVYGEGEALGFIDYAGEAAYSKGTYGVSRPLMETLESNSVESFVMNNAPLSHATFTEIIRTAKSGATFKYSSPSSAYVQSVINKFGDKAQNITTTTTSSGNPFSPEGSIEITTVEFTIK